MSGFDEQIEAVRMNLRRSFEAWAEPLDKLAGEVIDHLTKANEELRAEVESRRTIGEHLEVAHYRTRLQESESDRQEMRTRIAELEAEVVRLRDEARATIDRLTKERDEARRVLYAEVVRHSRELDTIRALVDGAIRRAGGTPKLTADYVAEPLRNLTKPEAVGAPAGGFPKHADDCEAMQWPRADCTCVPTKPEPEVDPLVGEVTVSILNRGERVVSLSELARLINGGARITALAARGGRVVFDGREG